jgi:hypothetical protein
MPMKYVCDVCGAEVDTVPPTWATIAVQIMAPNPAPAAPSSLLSFLYACELHDPTTIVSLFTGALKALPPAGT